MLLDFTTLPAFLLASAVVVLTPGVDAFLLLRTSLRQGIGAGLRALAGIHTASILQVTLVICGLGTLITNNPAVLAMLKWAGAAYLIYLAVMILTTVMVWAGAEVVAFKRAKIPTIIPSN